MYTKIIILITIIFASFGFYSCGNNSVKTKSEGTTKQQQTVSICQIHNIDCNKEALSMDMNLDEYHQWLEIQRKAIEDEDNNTDANGDIVDPNQPTQNIQTNAHVCDWCSRDYNDKGFLAHSGKVREVDDYMDEQRQSVYSGGYSWFCSQKCAFEYVNEND